MPASTKRAAAKTVLLGPVAPIEAWGVQQISAGNVTTGLIAMLIGTAFVAAYVVLQEYDLPYESEIISAIDSKTTPDETAEGAQDVAEDVADAVNDYQSSGSDDGR